MTEQRLFSVPKVGLFLDTYAPGVEKRREEDVNIITLTLRIQPFDAKLASAIDDGLSNGHGVRAELFKLSHPDPKPHLRRVDFSLDVPRQQLEIYAAPDAPEPRIAFDQVKVSGTYARDQKDIACFAFVLKASFGPVSREELEFIHGWFRTQRFVSFYAAEPLMDFEDDGEVEPSHASRPAPMFDDSGEEIADETPADADEALPTAEEVRGIHKPARARKRTNPEAERQAQREDGKKRSAKGAKARKAGKRA